MKLIFLLPIYFCFVSLNVHAQTESPWSTQVVQPLAIGVFPVGVGSLIEVNSQQEVFLGQLLNHDGSQNSMMILDPASATVKYAPASLFAAAPTGMQSVLKLYEQQGGTCTGYALDDFMLQSQLSGFVGNGQLATDISTEEGRTALLADTINQYYLVLQHRFSILGILNSYGKKYQFSCQKSVFTDTDAAHAFVMESVKSGLPVLIAFDLGPQMYDGPFKLEQLGAAAPTEDVRLWLPRKIGERNSGGHSVVAAAGFTSAGSDYLVMLDSDWDQPRVWDVEKAFGGRTAIEEVEFYTCQ